MSRDNEIVAVELEVAHRRHRHVEPERLPVVAVVKRDVDAALGSCNQQPASHRIFLDDVHVFPARKTALDRLPGSAHVASAIDVRLKVLELVTIDAGVGGALIEV